MPPQPITQGDKVTCRLCGRQFAKYNCPTCNVPYCSLSCFRSPVRDQQLNLHDKCSETFYKREVEHEIQSEPSKTPQERIRMMEMLKKFEEENQQRDAGALRSDDEEDAADDLARRFQDIDMDSASAADLWSKLTPAEQEQFLKLMEEPTSGLAQQLLASEELENERCEPWWEAPTVETDDTRYPRYRKSPDVIHVPAVMVKPIPNGSLLFYNMCAVCIAYSFTNRYFSVSPLSSLKPEDVDFEEARRLISQLVPFLTDRKSTTLYPNLSSVTTDIWSRFEPGQINSELFGLLLHDTAHLVCPLPVIALQAGSFPSSEDVDPNSHPHINFIRVLSDLTKLFELSPTLEGAVSKLNHVTQKLLFYAAQVLSAPSLILRGLSEELMEKSVVYQARGVEDVTQEQAYAIKERKKSETRTAIIEEM